MVDVTYRYDRDIDPDIMRACFEIRSVRDRDSRVIVNGITYSIDTSRMVEMTIVLSIDACATLTMFDGRARLEFGCMDTSELRRLRRKSSDIMRGLRDALCGLGFATFVQTECINPHPKSIKLFTLAYDHERVSQHGKTRIVLYL